MSQPSEYLPANELRQLIRQRRQALSPVQQVTASTQLTEQLFNELPSNTQRVALYLANDGEISPLPFIHACWLKKIAVCLPVLHPFNAGQLLFLDYQPHTKMQHNKYGIAEPKLDVRNVILTSTIDIIYTPLVAFDAQGNRMGMGGGYYDRTLAANSNITAIGIAHDCQRVDALTPQPWDMPLSQIITPTQRITAQKDAKK